MGLGPVGAGPAGSAGLGLTPTAPAQPPPPVTAAGGASTANAVPSAVIDAAFLSALSQPDLARLTAVLEAPQSPQTAERAAQLLQAAVTAAAAGDVERALSEVGALAALAPLRAEGIRAEPGLEPVRTQVDTLLARIINLARLDAESRVDQASRSVESGVVRELPESTARPEALLQIASQLLETGGHANAVRATQLAQVIIDAAHWAPAAIPVPAETVELPTENARKTSAIRPRFSAPATVESRFDRRVRERVRRLWQRGPLLVLLLGWLAIGLIGGLVTFLFRQLAPNSWTPALTEDAFDLWGLGFLALVLFGFYVRVRNVRL